MVGISRWKSGRTPNSSRRPAPCDSDAHDTPSKEPAGGSGGGGGAGGVGAIRLLNERRKHRPSLGGFGPPDAPVSAEVMNNNYEEWMKLATDNKINTTNTWSFALIDYFHDMSLLRNPDGTDSINFQKASCTLDGCVKIWTSRVDSVVTETGKLLSGLAEDQEPSELPDAAEEDAAEQSDGERKTKRKTARNAQTLAPDFDKLKAKSFDLEFTVDPLFKKTSADFDEGGASGILMNHLGCDSGMKVVFDAGDARIDEEDESLNSSKNSEGQDGDSIDVKSLAQKCLDRGQLEKLESMNICPSLSSFKFGGEGTTQSLDLSLLLRSTHQDIQSEDNVIGGHTKDPTDEDMGFVEPEVNFDLAGDDGGVPEQDFFADAVPFDGMGSGGSGDWEEGAIGEDGQRAGFHGTTSGGRHRPAEEEVAMMMGGESNQMFDYFDANMNKNWAGPEHWKINRPITKNSTRNEEERKQQRKEKNREKKEFSISFTEPATISSKELFSPPTNSSTTTLPRLKKKTESSNVLPDDMHFSSTQLLTLFLKPQVSLHASRRNVQRAPLDEDMDAEYWAQQAANGNDGDDPYDRAADDWDDIGGPMPFNTEFFHDDNDDVPDDDDFGIEIGDDIGTVDGMNTEGDVATANGDEIARSGDIGDSIKAGTGENDNLMEMTKGQTKRAKPLFVNYSKKAKRVDVKKLKENIWKGLDMDVEEKKDNNDDNHQTEEEEKPFQEVLSGLQASYPKERLEELSTSFCFICLLHLANERGLRVTSSGNDGVTDDKTNNNNIETGMKKQVHDGMDVDKTVRGDLNNDDDDDDEDEDEKRVLGGLETLKIFREAILTT